MLNRKVRQDTEPSPVFLTIIGYSGGGQLALNVTEKLAVPVDNVVLIGSPVMEVMNSKTDVSVIYSNYDPLSWNIGYGAGFYNVGNVRHTQYFNSGNIGRIAQLVAALIK